MRYYGIIPARAGSVGLPAKNKVCVANKPMINWTLNAALDSYLHGVVVTTDDDEIKYYAYQRNIPVINRLEGLATGDVHAVHPTIDAARRYGISDADVVMMLLPTVPERTAQDINAARDLFEANNPTSLIGVRELDVHLGRLRTMENSALKPLTNINVNGQRQESEKVFTVTGGMFMARLMTLLRYQTFHVPGAMPFFMPDYVDVDTEADRKRAETAICVRGR